MISIFRFQFPQQESQVSFDQNKIRWSVAKHVIQNTIKYLSSIFCLPMSNTSTFKQTYLHGKSLLSPLVLEESGGDLGKTRQGILAPASREDSLHSEAWSLLDKHHLVTQVLFSTSLITEPLVLDSSYAVLVFMMQLFCMERFIKRELHTLQQRIIYLP